MHVHWSSLELLHHGHDHAQPAIQMAPGDCWCLRGRDQPAGQWYGCWYVQLLLSQSDVGRMPHYLHCYHCIRLQYCRRSCCPILVGSRSYYRNPNCSSGSNGSSYSSRSRHPSCSNPSCSSLHRLRRLGQSCRRKGCSQSSNGSNGSSGSRYSSGSSGSND